MDGGEDGGVVEPGCARYGAFDALSLSALGCTDGRWMSRTQCGITLISSLPYYQVRRFSSLLTFSCADLDVPSLQVAFYLPTYTLSLSSNSASTATLVVSLVNGAASIGSIAIGWASDKNLPWTIATLGLASGVTALLAWGFASTLMAVFVFAIVYAPFTAVFSIWGAGARDVAGTCASSVYFPPTRSQRKSAERSSLQVETRISRR